MEANKILEKARNLIQDRSHWTVGEYARTEENMSCDPSSNNAAKWCTMGALFRAVSEMRRDGGILVNPERASSRLFEAAKRMGREYPVDVNDDLGHAKVMEMFDIAMSDKEEL